MKQLLAEHRPTICCEVHWLGEAFVEYCARELARWGYVLSDLNGDPPPSGAIRWHAVLRPRTPSPQSV
jgi:hypothetical protein